MDAENTFTDHGDDGGAHLIDPRHFEFEIPGIRSTMIPKIHPQDWKIAMPAARCRECGAVTWKVSLATGLKYQGDDVHKAGCSMPPSKLERTACEAGF